MAAVRNETLPSGDGASNRPRPTVIQGGMGVAVSGWRLAREVSRAGHLRVLSGTAMDAVLARRLQDGDPGGHDRRALRHFPRRVVAQRVDTYFVAGGRHPDTPYRPLPKLTMLTAHTGQELAVVGNFAEVWLAKEASSARRSWSPGTRRAGRPPMPSRTSSSGCRPPRCDGVGC